MSLEEEVLQVSKEESSPGEYINIMNLLLKVSFLEKNKFEEGIIGIVGKKSRDPKKGLYPLALLILNRLKENSTYTVTYNRTRQRITLTSGEEKVIVSLSICEENPNPLVEIPYFNLSESENLYSKVEDVLNEFLSGAFKVTQAKPTSKYYLANFRSKEITKVLLEGLLANNKNPIVEDLQGLPKEKYVIFVFKKGKDDFESVGQKFIKYTVLI